MKYHTPFPLATTAATPSGKDFRAAVMSIISVLFLAVCAVTFAGCVASKECITAAPKASSSDNISFQPHSVRAADGSCLQAFEWKPSARQIRGVVVIVHGIRDHSLRYEALARALVAQGMAVYAQDLRGHGHSSGDRQRFDSMEQLVSDADLAVAEASKRNPNVPVFMYGHSLGGLIGALYTIAHGDKLKGMILSGPALKLLPSVSGGELAAASILGFLAPSLPVQPVDDSEFVREASAKAALASDLLVFHTNLPARSAAASISGIDEVQKKMNLVKTPLLLLHGTGDKATNIDGSRELFARAATSDKKLNLYEGLYHDLMHEPERDKIIQDILAWLSPRLATTL